MSDPVDLIIIGAGITGLSAAREWKQRNPGKKLLLLEKSKGLGGRLATRRSPPAIFDHGAQFYRIGPCGSWHGAWKKSGRIDEWTDPVQGPIASSRSGMTDLAKELARDLEVKREAKVTRIETDPTHFTLHLEHGGKLTGKAVLLTAPLPQALLLLDASSLAYDPGLKTIDYDPALVLLLKLDKAPALPFWNLENPFPSIRSISNQETKGVSGTAAWTVVFDSSFSSTHFEGEETLVKNLALAEVLKAYPSLLINEVELKKWRYSRPRRQWRTTAETVTGNPRLVLAGDAFGGDGIDGALRSGKSAVDLLL